jgi:hypothetical protein
MIEGLSGITVPEGVQRYTKYYFPHTSVQMHIVFITPEEWQRELKKAKLYKLKQLH